MLANVEVPHERAARVAGGIEGYDIGVRLPRTAGRYVATVEASDGQHVARREVLLTPR